jgi:hypothetical protein
VKVISRVNRIKFDNKGDVDGRSNDRKYDDGEAICWAPIQKSRGKRTKQSNVA